MVDIQNCWEFRNCGREPGGPNVGERGVCPAATDKRYHGVNRGKAGGRFCWSIDGTLCRGGSDTKLGPCTDCRFYQQVAQQEGRFFIVGPQNLKRCPGPSDQAYVVLEAKPDPFSPARRISKANAPPAV